MRQRGTRMHRVWGRILALAAAVAIAAPAAAESTADDGRATTPVQLSLHEEIQVVGPETSVVGVRLAISARNADVTGFDQAVLAARTSGSERGLQVALYSEIEGDLVGAQLALISADVDGSALGLQWGNLINRAGTITGAQVAVLFNRALGVTGVQLSLVNYAEDLEGVQLGLININRNGWVPVFPGINIGF